jgi:tRNA (guanine10-N2)-dimethyltransferase
MHLLILSGENLELAKIEAESLLGLESTSLVNEQLYCTIPTENINKISRLAYTKKVYEIAYITNINNLESSLEAYPWINNYKKNFCIRLESNSQRNEKYYAKFVWKSLEKHVTPKVNLENSDLLIEIFIHEDAAIVCRFIYENFEDFESRKAHFRPVLHPTAMHPKMARGLVNILNPKPKEFIIDPFCGACGILTEAGLMNLKFKGYDIDKKIISDAKTNLQHYTINSKNYKIIKKDSTTIKKLKNIVTDLPYGLSSKKSEELNKLYSKFLKNVSGNAVIVMPDFINYKKLLKENLSKRLKVVKIIDYYVHKSLTRKIIIIK